MGFGPAFSEGEPPSRRKRNRTRCEECAVTKIMSEPQLSFDLLTLANFAPLHRTMEETSFISLQAIRVKDNCIFKHAIVRSCTGNR